ncbi:hypothetical protein BDY21DRAFT_364773 [Lineolata rhizophorae]|uniref:Uncharacterized protein n=1 Tax=Lineolata rhizophorae TaxID=578093 RepID=A0A6A6NW79_9PEZI|nr:hypothetical protein BDY21DRAFT_364773 [Lineolata rhizophorae]
MDSPPSPPLAFSGNELAEYTQSQTWKQRDNAHLDYTQRHTTTSRSTESKYSRVRDRSAGLQEVLVVVECEEIVETPTHVVTLTKVWTGQPRVVPMENVGSHVDPSGAASDKDAEASDRYMDAEDAIFGTELDMSDHGSELAHMPGPVMNSTSTLVGGSDVSGIANSGEALPIGDIVATVADDVAKSTPSPWNDNLSPAVVGRVLPSSALQTQRYQPDPAAPSIYASAGPSIVCAAKGEVIVTADITEETPSPDGGHANFVYIPPGTSSKARSSPSPWGTSTEVTTSDSAAYRHRSNLRDSRERSDEGPRGRQFKRGSHEGGRSRSPAVDAAHRRRQEAAMTQRRERVRKDELQKTRHQQQRAQPAQAPVNEPKEPLHQVRQQPPLAAPKPIPSRAPFVDAIIRWDDGAAEGQYEHMAGVNWIGPAQVVGLTDSDEFELSMVLDEYEDGPDGMYADYCCMQGRPRFGVVEDEETKENAHKGPKLAGSGPWRPNIPERTGWNGYW